MDIFSEAKYWGVIAVILPLVLNNLSFVNFWILYPYNG